MPSECIAVLYQLKVLYLISWFNYDLVNWKIHGTSSEGQNTQKFKEDWSIFFTRAVMCSAELQKSALIQTGKLILGLNNWITKQEDNSLPFMRCECVYCQPWLVCDWFICMLWFPKDLSSNYSCRNAFSTVLSTPLALSGTHLSLCRVLGLIDLQTAILPQWERHAKGKKSSRFPPLRHCVSQQQERLFQKLHRPGEDLVNNQEIIWIYKPLGIANTGSPPRQAQWSQGPLRSRLRSLF